MNKADIKQLFSWWEKQNIITRAESKTKGVYVWTFGDYKISLYSKVLVIEGVKTGEIFEMMIQTIRDFTPRTAGTIESIGIATLYSSILLYRWKA